MANWPAAGGTVRDLPTERNLRDIRKRGGDLETRAFQSFLQLTVSGTHEVAFGKTKLTWTASKTPASVKVKHGLNTTPEVVLPGIKFAGSSSAVTNTGEYTATEFTLFGFNAEVISLTLEVVWIALS